MSEQFRTDVARCRVKQFHAELRQSNIALRSVRDAFVFATARKAAAAQWRDICWSVKQEMLRQRMNVGCRPKKSNTTGS